MVQLHNGHMVCMINSCLAKGGTKTMNVITWWLHALKIQPTLYSKQRQYFTFPIAPSTAPELFSWSQNSIFSQNPKVCNMLTYIMLISNYFYTTLKKLDQVYGIIKYHNKLILLAYSRKGVAKMSLLASSCIFLLTHMYQLENQWMFFLYFTKVK
jgi:hypothetical protein